MADYGEILLEAIQTVVDGTVSKLEFDKTIIAKIIDNDDAESGEYIVSDGSTSFSAYSENTDYSVGTSVYVTIPNGDYSNQKIITGKYTLEDGEPYAYSVAWDKYIDITGNLFAGQALQRTGITANNEEETEVFLYESPFILNEEQGGSADYDTLGIKVDFKALLKNYHTVSGDYGLRFYIRTVNKETETYTTQKVELSVSDMVGNPYSFETFYNQQKLFDISSLGEIYSISVSIFQNNNFKDVENNYIPTETDIYGEYKDNIFIRSINVSLGYKADHFTEEDNNKIHLYALNSTYYDANASDTENTLKLRWISKDENSNNITIYSNPHNLPSDACVHWYQYVEDGSVSDEYAGVYWKEITSWKNTFEQAIDCQNYANQQMIQFKVIVETPIAEDLKIGLLYNSEINAAQQEVDEAQAELDEANANGEDEDTIAELEEALEELEETLTSLTEPYLAEVELYESDVLTLTNKISVADLQTLDLLQALTLSVDESGYGGKYFVYDQAGQIKNSLDSLTYRAIAASFESLIDSTIEVTSDDTITWRIPLIGSMIATPTLGIEYSGITDTISQDEQYISISRSATNMQQNFRIKDYYQSNLTNNTIYCILHKDGKTYQAEAELTFGTSGNNGTDYSFFVRMADSATRLSMDSTAPVKVEAFLYDSDGEEVDDIEVTFEWYSSDNSETEKVIFCDEDGNELSGDEEASSVCYIKRVSGSEMPYYYILKASVSIEATFNDDNVTTAYLSDYLPIPCALNYNYLVAQGANKVVYDNLGTNPIYYKEKYVLTTIQSTEAEVEWSLSIDDSIISDFYPELSNNGILIPTSTYINNIEKRICAIAIQNGSVVWTQPIAIYQDVYSSSLLNSWDGSLAINESDGTVLGTMLGAGFKDDENRFNGILLGDVQSYGDTNASTGLFGYNEGIPSFGFKNDGTAFIGKPNKGQIQFDGNSGSIQSLSYEQGSSGMLIDLDDGFIEMRGIEPNALQDLRLSSSLTLADFKGQDESKIIFYDSDKTEIKNLITTEQLQELIIGITDTITEKMLNQYLKTIKSKSYEVYFGEYEILEDNGKYYYQKDEGSEKEYITIYRGSGEDFSNYNNLTPKFNYNGENDLQSSFIRLASISPYFRITDYNNNDLIMIGDEGYYLQSGNFSDEDYHGIKFDLINGFLTGYDFSLYSYKTDISTVTTVVENLYSITGFVETYNEIAGKILFESHGDEELVYAKINESENLEAYEQYTLRDTYTGLALNNEVIKDFSNTEIRIVTSSGGDVTEAVFFSNLKSINNETKYRRGTYQIVEGSSLEDITTANGLAGLNITEQGTGILGCDVTSDGSANIFYFYVLEDNDTSNIDIIKDEVNKISTVTDLKGKLIISSQNNVLYPFNIVEVEKDKNEISVFSVDWGGDAIANSLASNTYIASPFFTTHAPTSSTGINFKGAGFYASDNGISLNSGKFYVTNTGILYVASKITAPRFYGKISGSYLDDRTVTHTKIRTNAINSETVYVSTKKGGSANYKIKIHGGIITRTEDQWS